MADVCVHCGWPAITHSLCLHHLEQALAAHDRLMDTLDTDADLADLTTRETWVRQVQTRMADIAQRRGHTTETAAA